MKDEEYGQHKWLFGAIDYSRAGHLTILKIFGCKVYLRCGGLKWFMGYGWGDQ